MTEAFVQSIMQFGLDHKIELVRFKKGQRKDDVLQARLRAFKKNHQEGVVFIGVAQEKARVPRTVRKAFGNSTIPWIDYCSLQTTIYSLANRGWSQRRIARELGLNRETVGRYLRLAKPAILTTGDEEGAGAKPAIPITGNQAGKDEAKPAISITGVASARRSYCEALAEEIAAKVEVGLSARRIYQDLVTP